MNFNVRIPCEIFECTKTKEEKSINGPECKLESQGNFGMKLRFTL